MRLPASITVHVDIDDPQYLWDSANARAQEDTPGIGEDAIAEMIGTREEPDLEGCLRMLFDPGESPLGCTINDSSAEVMHFIAGLED